MKQYSATAEELKRMKELERAYHVQITKDEHFNYYAVISKLSSRDASVTLLDDLDQVEDWLYNDWVLNDEDF